MTKVYVVLVDNGYDGDWCAGVFSTKEKAEQYANQIDKKFVRHGWLVQEFEVDNGF